MWWWYQFCLCQIRTSKVSFLNGWRQNITFSIKWWHWLGYMEEQSSFRKPHGRSLGAPDKIRACDTISITKKHGTSLKNKSLITLLTEVESIVNSGPLTVETLSDIGSEALLSPINLLTMISDVVLPPPGDFKKTDFYSCQYWRRIWQSLVSFGIDGKRSFYQLIRVEPNGRR